MSGRPASDLPTPVIVTRYASANGNLAWGTWPPGPSLHSKHLFGNEICEAPNDWCRYLPRALSAQPKITLLEALCIF